MLHENRQSREQLRGRSVAASRMGFGARPELSIRASRMRRQLSMLLDSHKERIRRTNESKQLPRYREKVGVVCIVHLERVVVRRSKWVVSEIAFRWSNGFGRWKALGKLGNARRYCVECRIMCRYRATGDRSAASTSASAALRVGGSQSGAARVVGEQQML